PDQALVRSLVRCLDGAARAQCHFPFDRVRKGMQLPQVDVVDTHPVKGPVEFLTRTFLGALVPLGRQEEPSGLALQPWPDAHLRLAVAGGHVQVVHPVGEQDIQGLVRHPLGHRRETRTTEDHPRAVMADTAELRLRDSHGPTIERPRGRTGGPRRAPPPTTLALLTATVRLTHGASYTRARVMGLRTGRRRR